MSMIYEVVYTVEFIYVWTTRESLMNPMSLPVSGCELFVLEIAPVPDDIYLTYGAYYGGGGPINDWRDLDPDPIEFYLPNESEFFVLSPYPWMDAVA